MTLSAPSTDGRGSISSASGFGGVFCVRLYGGGDPPCPKPGKYDFGSGPSRLQPAGWRRRGPHAFTPSGAARRSGSIPAIAAHRGRVVKRTGDGALVDVPQRGRRGYDAPSKCKAGCAAQRWHYHERQIVFALEFMSEMSSRKTVGDLMGDAVNVAARLEGACDPVKWTPFLGPGVKLEAGRSVDRRSER